MPLLPMHVLAHMHIFYPRKNINGALLASSNQRLMFKLQSVLKILDIPV